MIKPVKRNKRLVWDRSRYAIQSRQRAAWRNVQRAQILAMGAASINTIRCAVSFEGVDKRVYIALSALNTFNALVAVSK